MRLTKKGKYAVSAMLDIAFVQSTSNSYVKICDIAERQRIPSSYLEQILRNLRKADLLLAITGPNGGYRLSKSSSDISIADVVQCIEGKIDSTRCGGTSNCIAGQECLSHSLWTDLNAEMELFLSKRSLEDVLKGRKVKFSSHKSALETKNMIVIG